ncbi:hypothetical protein [Prescottella equi]|uniref:hypothetical protein n=1 Tax=Rhodococcus hoagii TaxID=43767 RepID=UPI001E602E76|nr:hypothetical protein [Prescottella equi]
MSRAADVLRRLVGGLFVFTAGIHVGIVAADPELYRPFADRTYLALVRTAWRDVFMAHPVGWGLVVAAGELAIGVLTLAGGRWTRIGLIGAIVFHVALMMFGWGYWIWSVPMLVVLGYLLRENLRQPRRRSV